MNDDDIGFANNVSIGFLDVSTMELTRIDHVDENHFIFTRIQSSFDWFYQGDVMIIPDPVPTPRRNWNKIASVNGQEIECMGEFIVFFHFENIKGKLNFATSLSLPEFNHIKQGLAEV
ncbi:hypothetical protein [Enterococcus timonensis]|uniref:hypothetical protein n=1 Tax=Enterococcus timonensis TaxID=1852364 RepID=UPI0008D9A6D6|nr:hypothetical protein [Enterococcus timonensis]